MPAVAVRSESGRQTTRVVPRAGDSAEASVRALGTWPPAGGVTLVSGRGSGQYDVRSTCAIAGAAAPRSASAATQLPAPKRRDIQDPPSRAGRRLYSCVQSAATGGLYGGMGARQTCA